MLQHNIAVMGEELGKQHTALMHEVAALHLYWKEFLELYGTSDKRIDRLNRSAPVFSNGASTAIRNEYDAHRAAD